MKKTTKFLLVLAAVVAMTIGAVSTVMAADDVVVATWDGDKGFTADGTQIQRGWAISKDSGIYYYFENGKIVKNTFVKTGAEIYFLGSEGAMHTGWLNVDGDDKFTFNGAKDVTLKTAFYNDVLVGSDNTLIFSDDNDKSYKTVWMYFNGSGALLDNEWEEVNGVWYYLDGPFCVMNDWGYKCAYDEAGKLLAGDKQKVYGFDKSGAMMAGWACWYKTTDTTANSGKPYEKPGESTDKRWVYYAPNGVKAEEGWLKDTNGDWFFMADDDETGVSCLTDSFIKIDGKTFYLDASGRMAKGVTALSGKNDGNKIYSFKTITADKDGNDKVIGYTCTDVTDTDGIEIEKQKTDLFLFDASTGEMKTGIQGTNFYQSAPSMKSSCYAVKVNANASGTAIDVKAEGFDRKLPEIGKKITDTFLYVKDASTVYYFYNGEMVKNDAIVFGDASSDDYYILAFGSDGKLITKVKSEAVKIGDVAYYQGEEVLPGTDIKCSLIK